MSGDSGRGRESVELKHGTEPDISGCAPPCSPKTGPCLYFGPGEINLANPDCPEHGTVPRLTRERENVLAQIRHRQERVEAIDAELVLARARVATKAQRAAEVAGEDVDSVPGMVLRIGEQE